MRAPTAVVVVPTRDRPEALATCLGSLRAQTVPVEIVVVDDGSRHAEVVRSVAELAGAQLLHGGGAGPAAARNRGSAATEAPIVCFIDDDCIAERDWAERLCEALETAPSGVVAGRTVVPRVAPPAARASQAIIDHLSLDGVDPSGGPMTFAPTCNLACSADLLQRLPFDQSFRLAAGEDREWSARAVAAGAAPRYVPGALVVHEQEPGARRFVARHLRYGRAAARRRGRSAGTAESPSSPGFYLRLLRRGFASGAACGILVAVAQVLTLAGVAQELRHGGVRSGRAGARRRGRRVTHR